MTDAERIERKTRVLRDDMEFRSHVFDKFEELGEAMTDLKIKQAKAETNWKWLRAWLAAAWGAIVFILAYIFVMKGGP